MVNVEYMNKIENTYVDGGQTIMDIPEMPYFDGEQYDLYDNKDYARFIADTERVVRMSYEYRQLINYLRYTEGMNQCSFLSNVTNIDSNKVKIEIHHTPLSLYDVCSTTIKKRLHNKESMDIYDVAEEVLWLHYAGWVGLIPVSATVHELIHNQYIFVPTNLVRGNYREFVNHYYDYIDPDILDSLDNAEEMTKTYLEDIAGQNIVNQQQEIFNLHSTYVRIKDMNRDEEIDRNRSVVKDRISEIKSGKKVMYRLIKKRNSNDAAETLQ